MSTVAVRIQIRPHLPEEPVHERQRWLEARLGGSSAEPLSMEAVVVGEGGVAAWLWHRWRALEAAGLPRDEFVALVLGYRRELWLWLAGERTWAQCCTGLIGRIERRLPD